MQKLLLRCPWPRPRGLSPSLPVGAPRLPARRPNPLRPAQQSKNRNQSSTIHLDMKAKNDMMGGGCRKNVDDISAMLRTISLLQLNIPCSDTYQGQIILFNLKVCPKNLGTDCCMMCRVSCPNDLTIEYLKNCLAQHLHVDTSSLSLSSDTYPNPNATRKLYELGIPNQIITLHANCKQDVVAENVGKSQQLQSNTDLRYTVDERNTTTGNIPRINNQTTNAKQTKNVHTKTEYVMVHDPNNAISNPIPIKLDSTVEEVYNTLSKQWNLTGELLSLENLDKTAATTIGKDNKSTLWDLGFKPNDEIFINLITKQQTNEAYASSTTTNQNQQNSPQMINVTFKVNDGAGPLINIRKNPTHPILGIEDDLKERLGCKGIETDFQYQYNGHELNTKLLAPLKDIFGNNMHPTITVRNVPLNVIQNYLTNQQNQQINNISQDQRQEEAFQINSNNQQKQNQTTNTNPLTQNQSFVPTGQHQTYQNLSIVPQFITPQQTIFPPKPVTTYPPPLLSLDNIAQAIRKQKNPKTRLRMKRKLATLKRIRAYLAKKRARSMFPSNNPHRPFMRQKAGYTPRKKKKHMATREKVISRMERNMRKRMKYKHKTKYKGKNLNDIRKYLIDENNAQNNLTSGYDPGYNNSYYNNY